MTRPSVSATIVIPVVSASIPAYISRNVRNPRPLRKNRGNASACSRATSRRSAAVIDRTAARDAFDDLGELSILLIALELARASPRILGHGPATRRIACQRHDRGSERCGVA